MNIVIVGDGKVGYTITERLSRENHDITVIDKRPAALNNTMNLQDVSCVEGNGVSHVVQTEAGVPKADLLIAATSTDEMNMLCCMVAKKLGAKHTIARVRDPQYQQQMFFLKDELGLSMTVNPEQAAAAEISRLLRFASAIKVEPFAKGRIELVEFKVREDGPLNGMRLADFYGHFKLKVLVCAACREDEVFIPKGNFVMQAGDKLSILAAPNDVSAFFRATGTFKRKVKDVMIVGGGKIAYYLARLLIEIGLHVKIIEKDEATCEMLCELLPKAQILHGDGTDHELLHEEGIDKTDALVALTGIDEENIILSMYANSINVDKVITKVNNSRLADMVANVGVESLISPKDIAANSIISYVRAMTNATGSNVETVHRIADGNAEALEFRVREGNRCVGIPLKDLPIRDNVLIGAIIRGGTCIIPGGNDCIKVGDSVIVVTTISGLDELNRILKEA
ncbi:MAG: Trk system potassium transporter TrkA [Clostridia bacterium]|nr:Trk system potassium transporter TrkA [Clostridia bacterium]